MPDDLSQEFEAQPPANLAAEFEAPPVPALAEEFAAPETPALAAEFDAPAAQPPKRSWLDRNFMSEEEYRRRQASGELPPDSGLGREVNRLVTGVVRGAPAAVAEAVRSEPFQQTVVPMIERNAPPMAAALMSGGVGLIPQAAFVAGSAVAGDIAAQNQEISQGVRQEWSPRETAAAWITAPLFMGAPVKPLNVPLSVAQGAAEGVIASGASAAIGGRDISTDELLVGALMGGVWRGVDVSRNRGQVLDVLTTRAREMGYTGPASFDDIRTWYRAETARPATAAAPAASAPEAPRLAPRAADAPTPAPAPEGGPIAPGGARAEFEQRAGLAPKASAEPTAPAKLETEFTPPAKPVETVQSIPRENAPAVPAVETTTPAGAEAQPPASAAGAASGSATAPEVGTAGGLATPSTPAKAAKGKSFVSLAKFPLPANGEPDLLNAIAELGGAPGPGKNAGGEYDGYAEAFGRGPARLLRRAGKGGIDTRLEELRELGYSFASMDDFYRAVRAASATRLRVAASVARDSYVAKVSSALFENQGRKKQHATDTAISSSELVVGTTFRVRGETFEVLGIDPDTLAVRIKGGAVIEIPDGTMIYPDGQSLKIPAAPERVDNGEVFEPATPWRAGLAGGNRYRQLSEKTLAGTATEAERAELARFEAAAGQAYVPGSMDATAVGADAARQADAAQAKQAAEIRAKAEARLLGGDLETQGDLFGAAPGETGMLFDGAALAPFFTRIGLPADLIPDAATALVRAARRIARLEFAPPYELPGNPGGAAPVATSPAPDALERRAGNAAHAAAPWLADPVKYAGPLSAALREHGRISSIVADYFTGQLPEWNPIGKTVVTPQDVVALMAPLRSPYAESFKAVVLDAGSRVVHAEVLHIGDLNSSIASVQAVVRAVERVTAKTDSRRVIISHNHPSGDPTPSDADWRVHEMMRDALSDANITLVDDVVTNGHAGYSLSRDGVFEMETPELAPWELIPRKDLAPVNNATKASEIAAVIRQSNPDAAFVIYLNNRNRIMAIEQMPEATDAELLQIISRGTAREGANGLILGGRQMNAELVSHVSERMAARGARVHDVSTEDLPSWAEAGQMPAPARLVRERTSDTLGTLLEDPAGELGDFDPGAPIVVQAGRKGAYVKVPLTRLKDIPIVQMPELVRLAKLLTGRVPDIKKLRKALGQFGGREATVTLDPRIFRNSEIAAKVLAHEIGHAVDYVPDQSLARGNLLGRIASLRNYLNTTLPLDPKAGGKELTPADRRALRAAAEKAVGAKPPRDEPDEIAAWQEQVAQRYAEKLQDELEARGLIVERATERGGTSIVGVSKSGTGIREELIGVTEYWKPIPENAPPAYVAYRYSGVELYADALSVLLNSPATLKQLAPTFYEAFFNWLDAKPEFKTALLDLYDFLNKPHLQVLEQRSRDIKSMFVKGDELILRKAAEREARYKSMRGWWDRFRQELFDVFDPLVKKGAKLERAGAKIPHRFNPRFLFDEHPLADTRNYEMVQHLWESVVKPIEADGFTLNDLGEYLFLQRVLNERLVTSELPPGGIAAWKKAMTAAAYIQDPAIRAREMQRLQEIISEWEAGENNGRSGVANPQGTTPETARLGLLRMRLDAGWQRFARLEIAAAKFHDVVFEQIKEAVNVGAYSQRAFVERLEPNRRYYAAFAVLDYLEDYVPASIRMSQGTFKEIANPFTATVLKMVSLNRLIQTQKTKRGTVEFLQTYDPANLKPAPSRFDGRRWVVEPPKDPDQGLLELLVDGKPAGWHVDAAVAEMFGKLTPAAVSSVLRVLNWPFRNLIYPLIIKYNPSFQLVLGPARDLRRTLVNVPRGRGIAQVGEFVRNYGAFLGLPPTEAGAAVRAYLRGEPHDLIAEMIATQAIGTPMDNFRRDFGRGDAMEKILADFGMTPKAKQPGVLRDLAKPIIALLEKIEFAGLTFEMLPKVSTYKMLTRDLGWDTKEAAYFVRNSVGVPNIHRKGRHTMVAEVVFPFTKVFINGLRSDIRLARGPKTAGGWWLRWAASDGVWTMLQAAAALGLLGAAVKELYDGISDYNKTNYNVLPLGSIAGGEFGKRVSYVRLPRDETHRLISGLLYQGMMLLGGESTPKGANSVMAFGADQVPGLNPLLDIAQGWKAYLEGENPKDSFRGSPVLSNAEYLAGGWPAMSGMLAFTADNMGVTNFVRWDPKANTGLEMALSAVPGVNRFVQTTAAGYRERQQMALDAEAKERAKIRVSMPDNVQRLAGEYYHLRSIRADMRTVEQTTRLIELGKWMKSIYQDYEDLASMSPLTAEQKRELAEFSAPYERR